MQYISYMPSELKKCNLCFIEKPVDSFYFLKKENRLYSYCKPCDRARKIDPTYRAPKKVLDLEKTHKECSVCNKTKAVTEFYKMKRKGGFYYTPDCKQCRCKVVKKWREENQQTVYKMEKAKRNKRREEKTAIVLELKKRGCSSCGGQFEHYQLDFDHVRGKKVQEIACMVRNATAVSTFKKELEKCDLMCAICHRRKTMSEIKEKGVQNTPLPESKQKLNKIKEETPCIDCNKKYEYFIMEYDHVRGTKVANVSKLCRGKSMIKAENEITKCELVCLHCHRKRTYLRAQESRSKN